MAVWRRVACALLACLAIAACTPAPLPSPAPSVPSTPAPAPTPSLTCTGTGPSPSPFPCDATTREAEQRALEEQAKAVYARYWKEYMRLTAAGGATEATPELSAVVAEPLLKDLVALLRYQKQHGILPVGAFNESLSVTVSQIDSLPDSLVAIAACEDTSGIRFRSSDGRESQGTLTREIRFFKRIDGQLKMYNGTSEDARRC